MNSTPPFTPPDPTEDSQGDLNAPDIVAPTGEEMPAPEHAGVHGTPEDRDGSGSSNGRDRQTVKPGHRRTAEP